MESTEWKCIHDELAASCVELFANYQCEVVTVEGTGTRGTVEGEGIISFIGFTGEHILGSLTLVAPAQLVERSSPLRVGNAPLDAAALCDWARELSNQLLGNLQNRLYAYGLDIVLSTPSAAIGSQLRGHERVQEGFCELSFRYEGRSFFLLFDALALPGTTLRRVEDSGAADADDGGIVML